MCMPNRFCFMKQLSHQKEHFHNHNNVQFQMEDTLKTDNYLDQKVIMDQTNFIISYHQTFRIISMLMNAIQILKTHMIFNLIKHFHKHQTLYNSNTIAMTFMSNIRKTVHKVKLINNIMKHMKKILFLFDISYFSYVFIRRFLFFVY